MFLERKRTGIVRYMGPVVGFDDVDIVGVELDVPDPRGNMGKLQGVQYFQTDFKRGFFVSRSEILGVEFGDDHREGSVVIHENTDKADVVEYGVGDHVVLHKERKGVIRYVGEVSTCSM